MTMISKFAIGAFALVALSGCYYYGDRYCDRYGDCGRYNGPAYYGGYYDGYYGPYYGGYWGPDGFFYYYDADRRYHRDDDRHFRHEQFEGGHEVHTDRQPPRDDEHERFDRDYERH